MKDKKDYKDMGVLQILRMSSGFHLRRSKVGRLFFLFIISFWIRPIFLANGAPLSLEDILRKMECAEKEISNIKFDFNQQVDIKITEEKYEINGYLVFKKPQKIFMESENHTSQRIISDGEYLWVYFPEYNQVSKEKVDINTLKIGLGGEFFGLGLGKSIKDLGENYEVKLLGEEENCYLLKIIPKRVKNYFAVNLWVSNMHWFPVKIEVQTEEMIVTSNISNIKLNTKIKEKLFKFKIPKGSSVFQSSLLSK